MRAVSHRPPFNSHPLAVLAAAFACGVLLVRVVAPALGFVGAVLCLAGGVCCALVSAWALRKQKFDFATWCVVVGFACAGAALAAADASRVSGERVRGFFESGRIASGEPVEVTGVLARAPEIAPDGLYVMLRVEGLRHKGVEQQATGAVQLFAPVRDEAARAAYAELELRRGGRVRVLVALERSERYRNPGGSSFVEFLEQRELDAVGTIKSPLLVERLDDERVLLPLVWLDNWREWLRARMSQTFSPETAGVLQASLLGNRYGLSRAGAERFREAGTFHVLVISGLHITFVGGLAWWLMRWLTRRRAWQFAASVVLLWAYALAVGAEVSVVRAALMFTAVAFAPVLSRRAGTLNALGAAALALLVWRPGDLFDPSFQLTFLSVLSIITLGWPLLEKLREVGEWRPSAETPRPPGVASCPRWFRALGEALYWSERAWQRESRRDVYSCRLFKSGAARVLERWRVQRLARYAGAMIVISACAQVCLLPLSVVYFHRFSPSALLLNLVVGVLMAVSSLAALAALLVAAIVSQPLAAPLVWLAEQSSWLMAHSVDPFARAGIASTRVPEYVGWAAAVYALYFLPPLVLAAALSRWSPFAATAPTAATRAAVALKVAGVAWLSLFALILAHPLSATRADGRLRVDFLDVGQGDAALLTLPDGATLLIDAGGRANFGQPEFATDDAESVELFERDKRGIGEAVVSEYLWWRGLDRVDYVLATHAHADHIEGLNDVARNFRVRAALVGRVATSETEFARLAATLSRVGVPLQVISRGDVLTLGGVRFDVLWPPRLGGTAQTASSSANDDSVVLRVSYGERCFLFTGDAERAAEAELVRSDSAGLRCDVVKIAHHGSRTSSTPAFIAAARARLAVVSVGASSPFGHPDEQVVERWRASGAEVLQTGRRGMITISTDGRDLRVETFASE